MTARAAPPAPSTSAARTARSQPDPSAWSRLAMKPITSVLSPWMRPSSTQSVLTAWSRRARSVSASASWNAACLCGMVMLPPRNPFP